MKFILIEHSIFILELHSDLKKLLIKTQKNRVKGYELYKIDNKTIMVNGAAGFNKHI